ncbi:flagellar motor switch phosphatase FliY [Salimicrobium halophilum]|uniref:Flagellar motor switch protein FliN/FliY n=1 Tax=Salimicrobium halophilum TaxID=86666 RepID=A0A1G8QA75_9BACI|nr:flagellar motor switch phosphatase FliY [Salimicrobium halophilum]SDJ01672.1 flagellar motor switch protein FliN/FliY [Salimicrobium halophilum]
MNDDMLSQDEIDALLNASDDDLDDDEFMDEKEEGESGDDSESFSDIEKDALGEIGNISFGNSATALSSLLNQKVEITTPEISTINRSGLDQEFPHPYVAIQVVYTEGLSGENLLVLQTKDAAIIADLMLGGDGANPEEELNDIHLSAVQEAMNQMMGSAATSMSSIFNKKVDISPPEITMLDIQQEEGVEHIPEDDKLAQISFRLKVGELIDSEIMQLLPVRFSKELVEQLMNPEGSSEPAYEAPAEQAQKKPEPEKRETKQPEKKEHQQPEKRREPAPQAQTEETNRGPQMIGQGANENSTVEAAEFESFQPVNMSETERNNLDMLMDIPLNVTVELGRTKRTIRDILDLSSGSIVELDKLAGEPVDIYVNEKLMATGEVVVIDENFGVRVTDILSQQDRLKKLR